MFLHMKLFADGGMPFKNGWKEKDDALAVETQH
jgi:hypothetical protein